MDVLEPSEVGPAHHLHVFPQETRQARVVGHQVDIVAVANVLTDLLLALAVEPVFLEVLVNVLVARRRAAFPIGDGGDILLAAAVGTALLLVRIAHRGIAFPIRDGGSRARRRCARCRPGARPPWRTPPW